MDDVAVIGGGIAGMATAARLQALGLSTVVFEAHGMPGGCAGYYVRRGFSFDVGATTLVDFESGGVGGELLSTIGMPPLDAEALPGYRAWLPDRMVTLHRDNHAWARERLTAFGDTARHRRFWAIVDRLADVFWAASRRGVKLPFRSVADTVRAAVAVGPRDLPLARYMAYTMGDLLRACGLDNDRALHGLLGMLIEDTVHSTVDQAPLINAALGITIRGAGLTRARGGMHGFWQAFANHYRSIGGELKLGHAIDCVHRVDGGYRLFGKRGEWTARQVVSAVPVELTARIGKAAIGSRLDRYIRRDEKAMGGAVVVFLGVPEVEVAGQDFTHHQLMQDYQRPLGNGNNMFVSVSSAGDTVSAPDGYRAVMISTHCVLGEWKGLDEADYEARKGEIGERLIGLARRVYPNLGERAVVKEVGTPRTYAKFTHRPHGAVGGTRLNLWNSNQFAVPHSIGVPGFHLVGDTTWPGLGTVACCLGSKIVAENVLGEFDRICAGQSRKSSLKPALQAQRY